MDSVNIPQREMPRYISCKQVWALKIARIEQAPADQERMYPDGDWLLHPAEEGYAPVCVGHDFILKHKPHAGGFLVQYQDGYRSFSPMEAFIKGSTPAGEWGMPRLQEPKYGINLRGKLFNRSTGKEVEEPVFVVRAKDTRALPLLIQYREMVPSWDSATRAALDVMILSFDHWRESNLGDMKDGDSKSPVPPAPHSIAPKADGRTPWPFPTR